MFDTTLQAMAIEIEQGEESVVLSVIVGLNIPVGQGPDGKIIMGQLPAGAVRIPMGREPAIEHGTKLREAGEALPEPKPDVNLVVANSLQGVDEAAKAAEKLRTGPAV